MQRYSAVGSNNTGEIDKMFKDNEDLKDIDNVKGDLILKEDMVHFELEEDFEPDYPKKSKYGWATNRIPLSRAQWLYLVIGQGLIPLVINFFINLFLTWAIFPKGDGEYIPFAGQLTCIFSDVIVTAFVLSCISTILGAVLVTWDLRKGKMVSPIDERWLHHPVLSWVPLGIHYRVILKRAVLFGIFSVVAVAPLTLALIYAAVGSQGMLLKWSYYIFKAIWCAALAAILSPIIAFILLASFNPRHTFY
ncbi:hypothetical protein DLAC_10601 [Tieghemostelium lacteum]|uniref:Transmembrane protein n=1 Tax=Tieghemostelium lacteum TaxID=361077 RepID=A0A151Z4S7_TIELA|nr:hypothetical protein DLAC_10601 [Tieghemostelium lacteum]|eukprot:KYQ88804.1 hypothetical protein DLAC_10601 [Tieghemostelium lacteum]